LKKRIEKENVGKRENLRGGDGSQKLKKLSWVRWYSWRWTSGAEKRGELKEEKKGSGGQKKKTPKKKRLEVTGISRGSKKT